MAKRIALFVLGLVVAIAAFLLYQHFSGATGTGGTKSRPPLAVHPETLPMTIESRNQVGDLEYVIIAPSSPVQLKDEQGNILPGQFRIDKPVATFYDVNGRTVEVRSDTCIVVMDQGAKGAAGGVGGLSDLAGGGSKGVASRVSVRTGRLEGHVRLVMGAAPETAPGGEGAAPGGKAGADDKDPFGGVIRIYFDGPLELDGNQEVLSTTQGIHVRSDVTEGDFRGMKMVFNQATRRLDYLRIEPGAPAADAGGGGGGGANENKLIMRGMANKALTLGEPAAPAAAPAAGGTARRGGAPRGGAASMQGAGAESVVGRGATRGPVGTLPASD